MNKAFKAMIAGATLALTAGGLALAAPAAHAATVPFTMTTQIANNGAQSFKVNSITPLPVTPSPIGTNWAIDNFTRTTTVDAADAQTCQGVQNAASDHKTGSAWNTSTDNCYVETITDKGTFKTVSGALQPNQGVGTFTNRTISNIVTGTFSGSASYVFWTANTVFPSSSLIPATLDQGDATDGAANTLTQEWYSQGVTGNSTPTGSTGGSLLNSWSWQYSSNACGSDVWTLSFDDNYGQSSNLADDGNITGNSCTPPVADQVTVANPGNQSTTVGSFVSLQLTASSNKGDSITGFTATGLPAGLSISSGGLISGTPNTSESTTVTVTATDSAGTTGSTTFTWNVTLTLPPPVLSSYGNNVNPFGNGFDVFRQHASVNTPIVGWPATQHDPATHFLKEAEGAHFRFEYAPNGVGDGLCVSNPGNNALVLRGCNSNVWQEFDYAGGHIVSVLNGGIINPNGTGNQLTVSGSPVPWGGSNYHWTAFSSLPA